MWVSALWLSPTKPPLPPLGPLLPTFLHAGAEQVWKAFFVHNIVEENIRLCRSLYSILKQGKVGSRERSWCLSTYLASMRTRVQIPRNPSKCHDVPIIWGFMERPCLNVEDSEVELRRIPDVNHGPASAPACICTHVHLHTCKNNHPHTHPYTENTHKTGKILSVWSAHRLRLRCHEHWSFTYRCSRCSYENPGRALWKPLTSSQRTHFPWNWIM